MHEKKFSFEILKAFVLALCLPFFYGCSSAPKRPMLVSDIYTLAYSRLESANSELLSGNLERAEKSLRESYSLAYSVDNAELLAKICLSGVSYKILAEQLGKAPSSSSPESASMQSSSAERKTSFLDGSADEILGEAKVFSLRSSSSAYLLDLCSLYGVRAGISLKEELPEERKTELLAVLSRIEKNVSKEPYYGGFLRRTRGDVYVSLSDFKSAESSYLEAAEIHAKGRYLYELALDWYCAARAFSLGGDKGKAVEAIEKALKYDRDAENTKALALDYLAYSKILLKGNPSDSEKRKAAELELISGKIIENSNLLKSGIKIEN